MSLSGPSLPATTNRSCAAPSMLPVAPAPADHPFGAILVDADGHVLMEQANGYSAEGRDVTAHAERLLASRAWKAFRPDFLAACTLYSSAKPCAMCAGAIYWAGIGRVVYGQSERHLKQTGAHPDNPTLDLPCRVVFAAGQLSWQLSGRCSKTRLPR